MFRILFFALITISQTFALTASMPPLKEEGWVIIDSSVLRTGDIVFRRGTSLVSQYILSQNESSLYSHSGIVYIHNDEVFVIHASASEYYGDNNLVRRELLQNYLSRSRASQAAVYRVRSQPQAARAAADVALKFVQAGVPFDLDFDLHSPESLYCTELVWRAYLEAGVDLVDGDFDRLSTPFDEGDYILPTSLARSPKLELITFH